MQPFIGQIMAFGFNFAPTGWAICAGQLLPIAQNTALFSILGTTYGGDGRSTFALPNLQGRCAIGVGEGRGLSQHYLGEQGGAETVTLTLEEIPSHNHSLSANDGNGTTNSPIDNALAKGRVIPEKGADPVAAYAYTSDTTNGTSGNGVGVAGENLPHTNMQPYLVMNYCIALQGIFPSRN